MFIKFIQEKKLLLTVIKNIVPGYKIFKQQKRNYLEWNENSLLFLGKYL